MTIQDVKAFLSTATRTDLQLMSELIKIRNQQLGLEAALSFSSGDKVYFDTKSHGRVHGSFVQFNRKNVIVKSNEGMKWTVSPQLLRKEEVSQ